MATLKFRPEGAAWDDLRAHLRQMQKVLDEPSVHLLDLAKPFQGIAGALLTGVKDAGISSARFEAVVKALDLKTPKSRLQGFLQP